MIIYKTTNLLNGKIYIGQDLYNNPNYYGSGIRLKNAIKKYGKENFRKDILEYCTSQEQLNSREKHWIACFKSTDRSIGYNISPGGDGGPLFKGYKHTEETKAKMREVHTGVGLSEEARKKISLSKKGKKRSEEIRRKMSDYRMGNKFHLGKKHTPEAKLKMSLAKKGKPSNRKSYKISEETKEKIRKALTGRKRYDKAEL